MKRRILLCVSMLLMPSAPAFADGAVTLDLASPSNGVNLRGYGPHTVEWTITAVVSSGDNMGLAMISVDLLQDFYNTGPVVLMPAEEVPAEMIGFDRPEGISNPGAGYVGTQADGWFGAKDLIQIGGAQNTFGEVPTDTFGQPLTYIGQDVDVDPNIGQFAGGQVIATGSFELPTMLGLYSFSLQNGVANTLVYVNEASEWSRAASATVQMGGADISLVVCLAGDANGDAAVTADDVVDFVDLLLGNLAPDSYSLCAVDLNDDGNIDGDDIQSFVDAVIND